MALRRSLCGKDVPWKSQFVQVTDSRPPTRQQVLGCCLKRTDQPGSKGAVMPAIRWPRPSLSWVLQTSFSKEVDRSWHARSQALLRLELYCRQHLRAHEGCACVAILPEEGKSHRLPTLQ